MGDHLILIAQHFPSFSTESSPSWERPGPGKLRQFVTQIGADHLEGSDYSMTRLSRAQRGKGPAQGHSAQLRSEHVCQMLTQDRLQPRRCARRLTLAPSAFSTRIPGRFSHSSHSHLMGPVNPAPPAPGWAALGTVWTPAGLTCAFPAAPALPRQNPKTNLMCPCHIHQAPPRSVPGGLPRPQDGTP